MIHRFWLCIERVHTLTCLNDFWVQETHVNPTGAATPQDKILAFDYWPDGSIKRKQLADGTWTGQFSYDLAGRLASIGNANTPSASEPPSYIASAAYNARGQTTLIAYGNGASSAYTYNDQRGFATQLRGSPLYYNLRPDAPR